MLLHLSDLHFGTEQSVVILALEELCLTLPLEAIAISGDLTQRARRLQFQAFFDFFNAMHVPWIVVPGNHDIPLYHLSKRMFNPFGHYESIFGATERVLETPHFHLVGVNSVSPKHHTRGRLTPPQIEQTAQRLESGSKGKHRIILSHQPFRVLRAYQVRDIPVLAKFAAQRWADSGLDAMLHGHFHVPVVMPLQQHFGLSKEVLDIQAGTGLSDRLRYDVRNSVNVIHPNMRVERYDFSMLSLKFELHSQLWPLPA